MGLYQYAIRLILSSKYCNLEIPCLFCKLENKYSRFYTRLGYIASSFLLYLYSFSRYHHFKKRPYPESQFLMRCRPESGNKFDKAATLVVAPKTRRRGQRLCRVTSRRYDRFVDTQSGGCPRSCRQLSTSPLTMVGRHTAGICFYFTER